MPAQLISHRDRQILGGWVERPHFRRSSIPGDAVVEKDGKTVRSSSRPRITTRSVATDADAQSLQLAAYLEQALEHVGALAGPRPAVRSCTGQPVLRWFKHLQAQL